MYRFITTVSLAASSSRLASSDTFPCCNESRVTAIYKVYAGLPGGGQLNLRLAAKCSMSSYYPALPAAVLSLSILILSKYSVPVWF
jgi:hypothetical protein